MNDCASKKLKLEINSYATQATAVTPKVDKYEQPKNQAHIDYVLVPRQLAQIAVAYVLNHEKLLDDGLSPRYLFNVPNLNKIGSTEPVASRSIATQGLRRKFVAILIADVAGYCRLMNEDEAATVSTLTAYKRMMVGLVKRYGGRVVDSSGDNLMAEFPGAVDTVRCAITVQNKLKQLNRDLSENRKMKFRIGINYGDVIDQGSRIYGDRVNIAARLEAIADPGGICISHIVYDRIKNKLPLHFEYLGEKKVKNFPKPVQAYRIILEDTAAHFTNLERETPDIAEEEKEIQMGSKTRRIEFIANSSIDVVGIPRNCKEISP
ncbi:MAG: adenylate/guanylate cyclase domain-containing protein [Deltaproteobacteria bacterium]|nr:adenylate/guanylate cyclase domain-containing protein [Deltaproteobacteria bacterium]MBT8375201.1 adenylate/guanylate cyclase domain-containing protein [Deltaproteobacteria bacterium]